MVLQRTEVRKVLNEVVVNSTLNRTDGEDGKVVVVVSEVVVVNDTVVRIGSKNVQVIKALS